MVMIMRTTRITPTIAVIVFLSRQPLPSLPARTWAFVSLRPGRHSPNVSGSLGSPSAFDASLTGRGF